MNKIKFSHHYLKLNGVNNSEPVTLVQVYPDNTSHLPDEFIEYDTLYFENGIKKNYPLEIGMECLVLLFVDSSGKLFSTIRRSTPSKDTYYMTAIGSDFKLEYTNIPNRK